MSLMSRRDILKKAGNVFKISGAAAVMNAFFPGRSFGIFGIGKRKGLEPDKEGNITLLLKDSRYKPLREAGRTVKVEVSGLKKPLILINTSSAKSEMTLTALSTRCTHFGCEVRYEGDDLLRCPCHKAEFDLTGKVLKGPADEDLDRYPVSVEKDKVIVNIVPGHFEAEKSHFDGEKKNGKATETNRNSVSRDSGSSVSNE